MRKRIIQVAALLVALLAMLVVYRLGDRRITIYVDGEPAAGRTIHRFPGLETIQLDDSGSADLSWGLEEDDPYFIFRSQPDRNWMMRLPSRGRRIYRIDGSRITTETTTLDIGFLKITDKVEQRSLSDEELKRSEATPKDSSASAGSPER